MDFLQKIDYLMSLHGLNKNTLAIKSDIPYTTIYAFYKKGYEKTKLSTLRKLANALETTLDYLICDDVTDPTRSIATDTSAHLQSYLTAFHRLNDAGQAEAVKRVEELEYNPLFRKDKTIPLAKPSRQNTEETAAELALDDYSWNGGLTEEQEIALVRQRHQNKKKGAASSMTSGKAGAS